MIRFSDDKSVAAMTTIIIFLPLTTLIQCHFFVELQAENSSVAQGDPAKMLA